MLKQVNENPEEIFKSNAEFKKFFFEEFIGGITKRITQVKSTTESVSTSLTLYYLLLSRKFLFTHSIT